MLMKIAKGKISAHLDNTNYCKRKHNRAFYFQWIYEINVSIENGDYSISQYYIAK